MTNEEYNRDALIAHIQAQDTIIRTRNGEIARLKQIVAGEVIEPDLWQHRRRSTGLTLRVGKTLTRLWLFICESRSIFTTYQHRQ